MGMNNEAQITIIAHVETATGTIDLPAARINPDDRAFYEYTVKKNVTPGDMVTFKVI